MFSSGVHTPELIAGDSERRRAVDLAFSSGL